MSLPKEVESVIRFFDKNKIWHKLSNNSKDKEVFSCPDAASNRIRLCNDDEAGIPIFDELKSELGYFINKDKRTEKVLVHCRGNQKVDRLKISNILNSEYRRVDSTKIKKGLINPFSSEYRNLLQIFDISTTQKFHPPFTMMTNAGDFKYGIEFHPHALIQSLKRTIIDDIIRRDNYNCYIKHKIGILTGNGPDSGMLLWRKINEAVKTRLTNRKKLSFRGDLSYPEISIESIPEMGISMELEDRLKDTEFIVLKSVINLCKNGATIICLACNTTQYFKPQIENICRFYGAEFLSMPDVLENYLLKHDVKKFDFIGISYVTDFKGYSAYKNLERNYSVEIPKEETLKEITRLAFVAKMSPKNYQKVRPLGNLLEAQCQNNTIVIALTEISTVLDYHPKLVKSKHTIDTLQLIADKVADKYVDGIFDTLYLDFYKENTSFHKLKSNIPEDIKNQLWKILLEIDYEFIPPLSFRDSTTFSFDDETKDTSVPQQYFDALLEQQIIISKRKSNDSVTGFMSYKPSYIVKSEKEYSTSGKPLSLESHYITTIGVTKGARGNGITRMFYKEIEKEVCKSKLNNHISTRTWSTNQTHIRILESLGYKKIIEIENDRGAGIHTVYFAKEVNI